VRDGDTISFILQAFSYAGRPFSSNWSQQTIKLKRLALMVEIVRIDGLGLGRSHGI
jgi:hypothetical protein